MSMINVSLFSQVLKLIDEILKKIVITHNSDKHNKGINSWTNLVFILFMQWPMLTPIETLVMAYEVRLVI